MAEIGYNKSPLSPCYLSGGHPRSNPPLHGIVDGNFNELFENFSTELTISPLLSEKMVNGIMEVLDLDFPQCFDERDCQDLVDMQVEDASRL